MSPTLAARSELPTLASIAPYRDALAVFEYRAGGEPLRVVQRVLLDGHELPGARRELGDEVELRLEPFADHPQLASVYLSDTLPIESADSTLWFAVAPD